ncbi:MAG TPA: carbohydrate ABC transporter permease [Chthonomonadaceae bacterium]|nr:carbohydrate ABC transporter permease [Chthonomonadaceae bacterium]
MTALTATPGGYARVRKARLRAIVTHALLLGIGVLFGLPFYWLIATSLKPDAQIFQMPPVWVPHPVLWSNYPRALTYIPYLTYTFNTLFLCLLNVIGTVLSCSLVAYSLAKIRWKGRNVIFYSLLATMILPGQVTLIPTFAIFKWLGWIGSYKPLFVPAFFGSAFYIFLLRQFFMTLPNELSDAARIDGCTELDAYGRVILPLARPALVTVALFTFIGTWNDFMGPLLYLTDERTYTLSMGLQFFVSQHGAEWGMLMAASAVMTLPIVVVFFLAQRTFIQGVTLTGIKG